MRQSCLAGTLNNYMFNDHFHYPFSSANEFQLKLARCLCFGSWDAVYIHSASTAAWSAGEKATKEYKGRMLEGSGKLKLHTHDIESNQWRRETWNYQSNRCHWHPYWCASLCTIVYIQCYMGLPTKELTEVIALLFPRLDAASQWRAVLMPWVACHGGWRRMLPRKSCWNAFNHLINWSLTSTPEFTGKFTLMHTEFLKCGRFWRFLT